MRPAAATAGPRQHHDDSTTGPGEMLGATNVKLAYAHWGDLAHAPFRLLAYMALVCKDGDAPRYWAGWESLAVGLGRMVPPESDDETVKAERRAALKGVTKVIGTLKDCGALRIITAAAPGKHAVYELRLHRRTVHPHGGPLPVDDPVDNPGTVPPEGAASETERCTLRGTNGAPSGGRMVPPEGAPEEERGRIEEEITTGPTHGAGPTRARPRDDDHPSPSPPANSRASPECPECGAALDPDGTCFACRTPRTA